MTVHIHLQQTSGNRVVTTIENFDIDLDIKKICKVMKRMFSCNGTIDKKANIILLQGDHRVNAGNWIRKMGIANDIMIHG